MSSPNPVVSNTTPVITLAGVGLLDLLPAVYGDIWIAEAVYHEYQSGRATHPGSPDLDTCSWLSVHSVHQHPPIGAPLDAGELATIALAIESNARLTLLDEQRARREAVKLGLPIAGSLTVLLEAKKLGLIPQVASVIDQMIAQGRRISSQLKARVLELANE